MHRSRICQFVIDVSDLDQGVAFWTAALDAEEEQTSEVSRHIYRRIRLPDSEIRFLLQKTGDRKTSKERMHIDLETDNVEAEVERLEKLGAVRWDHQQERGFDFWVLRDPWGNEFCVLQEEFPELLAKRRAWPAEPPRKNLSCQGNEVGNQFSRMHRLLTRRDGSARNSLNLEGLVTITTDDRTTIISFPR